MSSAADAADEARYRALINELRCLVCQNQSIAESNAPLAADLREQVRAQIAAGRSDAEIVEFVTARYGDFVLYRPPFKASTWLLWLGPFAVLALAGLAVIAYVRRSRTVLAVIPGEPGISRIAGGNPRPANGRGQGPRTPEAGIQSGSDEEELDARRSLPSSASVGGGHDEKPTGPAFSLSAVLIATGSLVIFAAIWYFADGSWRTQALIELAQTDPAAAQEQAFHDTFERLQEHVAGQPDDAEAWVWLGRAYARQDRFGDAAIALARANELNAGRDPDLLVEEGEFLVRSEGMTRAAARFEQALALAPEHPRALWFAGLAALHTGNEPAALGYWERLAAQDMPGEVREALDKGIAELRQRTGIAARPRAPGLTLRLRIELAPELADEAGPGDTLFLYARSPGAGGPPLAARRIDEARPPLSVTLDDSHSMLPGRKLSSADRWRVVARLSRSGDAAPQAGDLEGEVLISRDGAKATHNLRIERRRP